MPVPPKRRSRSKARRGRAHQALTRIKLSKCPKCGQAVLPHRACVFCGAYKGREVVKLKKARKQESKKA